MAKKTVSVNARIDPELKQEAEEIIEALGLIPSTVIALLYKQIALHRAIPFDLKMPELDTHVLSEEQFNAELEKGLGEVVNGETIPTLKVFTEVK